MNSKCEWKEFYLTGKNGVFNIESSLSGIDKNKIKYHKTEETIPYITRSENQNGINMFISPKQDDKYKMNKGNTITIGLDTQTIFYQKHSFFTGQNIQVLDCKELNENRALFCIPLIKRQLNKFNWGGNGATLGRLSKTKVILPCTEEGEVNWEFMDSFVQKKKEEKIKLYFQMKKQLL